MIIYNTSKRMKTGYMKEDGLIIEINSGQTVEEILQRLRNGEDLPLDGVSISVQVAHAYREGKPFTNYVDFVNQENTPISGRFDINHTFPNMVEQTDRLEEFLARDNQVAPLFKEYEAFIFLRNEPDKTFHPYEITKEELMAQLYSVLNIMPTVTHMDDKSVTELKKLSASGDRLFRDFGEICKLNQLPTSDEIMLYESLTDYEKRIIHESLAHPMKLLHFIKNLKTYGKDRLFTIDMEENIKAYGTDFALRKAILPYSSASLRNEKPLEIYLESRGKSVDLILDCERLILSMQGSEQLEDIEKEYKQHLLSGMEKEEALSIKREKEFPIFVQFAWESEIYNDDTLSLIDNPTEFIEKYTEDCRTLFNTFISKQEEYTEYEMLDFLQSKFKAPALPVVERARTIFKEMYNGFVSPILPEYLDAALIARNLKAENVSDAKLREILTDFSRPNMQKIAKHKNPIMFALSDKLNFNEMKIDHLYILASLVSTKTLHSLLKKGFVEWYKEHKDTNNAELTNVISQLEKIKDFDKKYSAKQLIARIKNARGIAEAEKYARSYPGYNFENNELAIKGRHTEAFEGRMKMFMRQADDYAQLTDGIDTHCCQHHGGAGGSCCYKYTTDPFATTVVIERDGKVLAQGFVWVDVETDTLVFDNVEFADDRNVTQFHSLFAAWCQAMPYRNIHVGTGYNHNMNAWGKKAPHFAKMPTTIEDGHCYSDYHKSDARALKINGEMQILPRTAVKVETAPDEPTRWDTLATPELAFLLNDCHTSIEERMDLARRIKENPDDTLTMEILRRNPAAIAAMDNPSREAQELVVRANREYALLIKNPCPEVQAILLTDNPEYIRNIENPTEEMMKLAVRNNGLLLSCLKQPTDAVRMDAITQNGYAIAYIENPTVEMQRRAIESNPKVVSLIQNPTVDMQMLAIDCMPEVIELINEPDVELQLRAIRQKPYTINLIKNPDITVIREAISREGSLIRNFSHMTEFRTMALEQNPFAIRALPSPTEEEWILAASRNRNVLKFCRDALLRDNIEQLLTEETIELA